MRLLLSEFFRRPLEQKWYQENYFCATTITQCGKQSFLNSGLYRKLNLAIYKLENCHFDDHFRGTGQNFDLDEFLMAKSQYPVPLN